MINIKEIFDAWVTSFNPNEKEAKLAEDRYKVCKGCDFRKEVFKGKEWSLVCGSCGCPLNKKIYSKAINPCPEGKWFEVDKKHKLFNEMKIDKTVI